jgi:hypothetical protein
MNIILPEDGPVGPKHVGDLRIRLYIFFGALVGVIISY